MAASVHEVCADEASEVERAAHGVLRRLGQAQQQEGDERDGDLDAHGVFAEMPMKCLILRVCLTQRKNNSICQRCL